MLTNDIQIRFSDIDAFNHVNNINIQHYYDYGKMIYYNNVLNIKVMQCNPSLVIVNVVSNYLSPILVSDNIAVETSVIKLGSKSLTFFQRIVDKTTGEEKSNCTTIMVVIDREKNSSCELLDEWKDAICKQEKKSLESLQTK